MNYSMNSVGLVFKLDTDSDILELFRVQINASHVKHER